MNHFLGIDTSCYTTSVALCCSGQLLREERTVLTVPAGHRGLSQSEMVYQHVRNLPVLFKRLEKELHERVGGIGVSAWPRRRADSYMPAFLAGKGAAEMLASCMGVPLFLFSHQENHAMAALREYPSLWGQPFYMMHLSGGTNDVLSVEWVKGHMEIRELIASADVTAGQYIDRIGVALGLSFPAGAALEKLATGAAGSYEAPISRFTDRFSFSGPETKVQRDIAAGTFPKEEIASGVLTSVGNALEHVLKGYPFKKGRVFLSVGGVMANQYLRRRIEAVNENQGLRTVFAVPQYSSDNATGNAFGAYMMCHQDLA